MMDASTECMQLCWAGEIVFDALCKSSTGEKQKKQTCLAAHHGVAAVDRR
jgi:hypothetical protein